MEILKKFVKIKSCPQMSGSLNFSTYKLIPKLCAKNTGTIVGLPEVDHLQNDYLVHHPDEISAVLFLSDKYHI